MKGDLNEIICNVLNESVIGYIPHGDYGRMSGEYAKKLEKIFGRGVYNNIDHYPYFNWPKLYRNIRDSGFETLWGFELSEPIKEIDSNISGFMHCEQDMYAFPVHASYKFNKYVPVQLILKNTGQLCRQYEETKIIKVPRKIFWFAGPVEKTEKTIKETPLNMVDIAKKTSYPSENAYMTTFFMSQPKFGGRAGTISMQIISPKDIYNEALKIDHEKVPDFVLRLGKEAFNEHFQGGSSIRLSNPA